MFKTIVNKLIINSGNTNVNFSNIVNSLNIWWKTEKESDRLDDIKSQIKMMASMGGIELIKFNQWYYDFANSKCNYKYIMNYLCSMFNIENSQSELLFSIIIDEVLIDDLVNMYPKELEEGNRNTIMFKFG